MFKPKRRRSNVRKATKEDDSDSDIVVNIEEIKEQQKLRNEVKSGVSATTLLTGMNVVVDPLTHRVITKSDFKEEKNDNLPIPHTSDSDEDEEQSKKLMRYRIDENAIYEPEGFVLTSIAPEPITEHHIVKEIEPENSGKRETLEDIALMKIKMSKQLKRERREMSEKKKL